jgi:hypothetical protein
MKYFYLVVASIILSFSCGNKMEVQKYQAMLSAKEVKVSSIINNMNHCPNFDSSIYHHRWVKISEFCYVSNRIPDSVFVINKTHINFTEFVKQVKPVRLKNLNSIDKDFYSEKYSIVFFTENLTKQWSKEYLDFSDARVYGYLITPHINYIVVRFHEACMGSFTSIISINKNDELVDYKMLTGYFGGKYGDGPNYEIKQVNDSVYNQVYEITTCRGWDDAVKKDSLFREYYSKTRITLSHTGHFMEEKLEVDSSLTFIKMVNICGPE